LKDAESAFKRGVFYDCVYHSASAAENAADTIILWLGGTSPHMHRDSEAMEHVARRARPRLLKDDDFKRMVKKTGKLERHVVKSKYPVEVEDGVFLPPEEFYKEEDAKRMLKDARWVVGTVKRFLGAKSRG
jgi:HEPN domain-containing protein